MPVILYSLFIVAMSPIVLAWVGGYFRVKQFGKFDNNHPRAQQMQLTGAGARAMAAQNNSWEALGIYTAVCFIAYASGLPLERLDVVAIVFVLARVVYAILYLANLSTLRSLTFLAGMSCCFYIIYLAATFKPDGL